MHPSSPEIAPRAEVFCLGVLRPRFVYRLTGKAAVVESTAASATEVSGRARSARMRGASGRLVGRRLIEGRCEELFCGGGLPCRDEERQCPTSLRCGEHVGSRSLGRGRSAPAPSMGACEGAVRRFGTAHRPRLEGGDRRLRTGGGWAEPKPRSRGSAPGEQARSQGPARRWQRPRASDAYRRGSAPRRRGCGRWGR